MLLALGPAPSHVEMLARQRASAARANGTIGAMPRLTNGEVVQLAEYWRKASKERGKDFGPWFNLVSKALGFFREGDKFRVDDVHGSAMFPDSLLPLVWSSSLAVAAVGLDAPKATTAPAFETTRDQSGLLKRVAGEAFRILQRQREARGEKLPPVKFPPTIPPPLDKIPDVVTAPFRGSGIGTIVVIVLVAMALSKKGRR
jgi:hypothetical protein